MKHTMRYFYRLLHRYNPFRAEVGLRAIGNPGIQSPVLVSGNYEHTVEQLEEVTGMEKLLRIAQRAGERNIIMLEAYLSHEGE